MNKILIASAFLSGIASALPAAKPLITPPPVLRRRQDGEVDAQGCTITWNPETAFEYTYLDVNDDGDAVSTTSTISIPAQNGCNCDNGVIAGIFSSVGQDGQTTLWCATGTPFESADAQSTIIAEPTPGAADNAGWAQVQCSDGDLDDLFNNPWTQWNDSGAEAAWYSMLDNYEFAPDDQKKSLSTFMGNYFHTKPNSYCENLADGACTDTIQCGQNADGGDATAPAGYVLFNSFVGIHNNMDNMYEAIDSALARVVGRVGTFVETLSPINEDIQDEKRQKIAFDIAQACLFTVLAPTFHSGFSRIAWVNANPNFVAAGFDFTYGMIGTSFALAKDSMAGLTTVPATNELSSLLVETAKGWLQAVTDTARGILNDPDRAFEFINQGKFFPGEAPEDPVDAAAFVEKALLAGALSAVWVTGDPEQHGVPVIVNYDDVPQDGSGCESYKPEEWEFDDDDAVQLSFQDDVLDGARTCIGDNAYWLMSARLVNLETGGCNAPPGGPGGAVPVVPECDSQAVYFEPLYNLDKIEDFNLTKEEVVGNAVNSWAANGNANGWDPLQLADAEGDEITDLITQNLGKTKGVVKIPVCSFNDLMSYMNDNLDSGGDPENPNHPCPP